MFDILRNFPSSIQGVVGYFNPKVAGKVAQVMKQKQCDYLKYLVSVRYNQKKSLMGELDEYTGRVGVGLGSYVKQAIQMVKDDESLIPRSDIRKKFVKQNPLKCAKELCTSITRYIWMEMAGVDLPEFEVWYIDCCAKGYIGPDRLGNFNWVKNSFRLISGYMVGARYGHFTHNVNFTNASQMIQGFANQKLKVGMVRKGTKEKNTHTYLVSKIDGKIIMFDTWWDKYTGQEISTRHPKPDALWFIYWY